MATWTGSLVKITTLSAALLASGLAMADARIDPLLSKLMVKAKATDQLQVVVSFKQSGPVTPAQVNAVRSLGITKGVTMRSLPIMGALATPARIKQLAKRSDVVSIYYNKPLKYFNLEQRQISGSSRVLEQPSLLRLTAANTYTGKGVTVVVNDSGIDTTNPDLPMGTKVVDNVQAAQNTFGNDLTPILQIKNQINTDLGSGHGTHCAGTVGGTGAASGGRFKGAAPNADIVGYGSGGVLLILDAVGGLDYALTNQFAYRTPIRVVSNSWGSSGKYDPLDPVSISTYNLYKAGIVSVFAAGNDGPGEDTHNPYAQAPWVISVGAGEKDGVLTGFSSRGKRGEKGQFTMPDGSDWTYYNQPTIVATGVNIVSTRALTGALPALAAQDDAAMIAPAQLPYYTLSSGTSMATPHVAGVVAQMLEANKDLNPLQVKEIIKATGTNMSGRDTWEVGAGHLNAFAAVAMSAGLRKDYGSTTLSTVDPGQPRAWKANEMVSPGGEPITKQVSFVPVRGQTASQAFKVEKGVIQVSARVVSTANPVAVVLIDPKGKRYGSGVALPVLGDTVTASAPVDATTDGQDWQVTVRGVGTVSGVALDPVGVTDGVGAPETFDVVISTLASGGFTGLGSAVATHPLRTSIEAAISRRLMDSRATDNFAPDESLTRAELAQYLVMGANIRQHLPFTAASQSAADVAPTSALYPVVESVLAAGGVLRDLTYRSPSVMSLKLVGGKRVFQPEGAVSRLDLAQSLVKALGPAAVAAAQRHTGAVTYTPTGATAPVMVSDVAMLTNVDRGYVQQAIANGIIIPVMEGSNWVFKPSSSVTRAQYAQHAVAFSVKYRTGEDGL